MTFLQKLQNQSERKKKVILWTTVIIMGLGFFALFVKNAQKRMENFQKEKIIKELQLPKLQEEFKNLPGFEMPKIGKEEFKKAQEIIKESQQKGNE